MVESGQTTRLPSDFGDNKELAALAHVRLGKHQKPSKKVATTDRIPALLKSKPREQATEKLSISCSKWNADHPKWSTCSFRCSVTYRTSSPFPYSTRSNSGFEVYAGRPARATCYTTHVYQIWGHLSASQQYGCCYRFTTLGSGGPKTSSLSFIEFSLSNFLFFTIFASSSPSLLSPSLFCA